MAKKNANCNETIPGAIATDAWTRIAEKIGLQGDELMKGIVETGVSKGRAAEPKDIGDVGGVLVQWRGAVCYGGLFAG